MDVTVSGKPSFAIENGNPEETSSRFCIFIVMLKHHTKTKGDLGVLKAKLDLFEKGF